MTTIGAEERLESYFVAANAEAAGQPLASAAWLTYNASAASSASVQSVSLGWQGDAELPLVMTAISSSSVDFPHVRQRRLRFAEAARARTGTRGDYPDDRDAREEYEAASRALARYQDEAILNS